MQPKSSKWGEIIKIRTEINEIETIRKNLQRIKNKNHLLFQKKDNIDKPLAKCTTREKIQINKIEDENEDITPDTNLIHKIMMIYLKNSY